MASSSADAGVPPAVLSAREVLALAHLLPDPHDVQPNDPDHPAWQLWIRKSSGRAICRTCSSTTDWGNPGESSTWSKANMLRHTRRKHPDLHTAYVTLQEYHTVEAGKRKADDPLKTPQSHKKKCLPSAADVSTPQITSFFGSASQTPRLSAKQQQDGHLRVLLFLVKDQRSFHTVQGDGFQEMLATLQPGFQLHHECYYRRRLRPYARKLRQMMKPEIAAVHQPSFTTDMWSTKNQQIALMSLTMHWINPQTGERRRAVLLADEVNTEHTGEEILRLTEEAFREWNIPTTNVHIVVRDGGSNVKKAFELGDYLSFQCFCHLLHLVLQDAVSAQTTVEQQFGIWQELATFFHKSNKQSLRLKECQQLAGLPTHVIPACSLIKHWSGRFKTGEMLGKHRTALELAKAKYSDMDVSLPNWEVSAAMTQLLKIVHAVSVYDQSHECMLADLLPQICLLRKELTPQRWPAIERFRKAVMDSFEDRVAFFMNWPPAIAASMMNPAVKAHPQVIPEDVAKAVAKDIVNIIVAETPNCVILTFDCLAEDEQLTPAEPTDRLPTHLAWLDVHDDVVAAAGGLPASPAAPSLSACKTAFKREADRQLKKYLEAPRVKSTSPGVWWVSAASAPFALLRPFALSRLGTPASTAQSEQLFKHAVQIRTPERNRLKGSTLRDLLFVMFNLRFGLFAGPASLEPADLKIHPDEVLDETVFEDVVDVYPSDAEDDE